MFRKSVFGMGLGILVVAACVGSDPDTGSGSSSSSSGGSSGASSGSSGSDGGGCAGDQPSACGATCVKCPEPAGGRATCTAGACGIACDAPKTACGSACADLANDSASCGRCGRSCGAGSSCSGALCSPVQIADVFAALQEIAITGQTVYFSTPTELQRVAKTGGTPTSFFKSSDPTNFPVDVYDRSLSADPLVVHFAARITTSEELYGIFDLAQAAGTPQIVAKYYGIVGAAALSGNLAAWTGSGNIHACAPGTACGNLTPPPDRATAAGVDFIAIAGTSVVWTQYVGDVTGTVYVSAQVGERVAIAATPHPFHVAVHDDVVYWTDIGNEGPPAASGGVYACALAGCSNNPTKIADLATPPGRLAVDDTGVYFTVTGGASAATGEVKVCRDRAAGCAGGNADKLETLAKGLERPNDIEIDATDVFFTVHPTPTTGRILRVAK